MRTCVLSADILPGVEAAHKALLDEIRRRLDETRADPMVTNTDGSNYWGPYVTRAINERDDDGPALVAYIKGMLRKTGDSQGWNALLEADRLDLSFEDMVLHANEPIRELFDDEDRQLAALLLGDLHKEAGRQRELVETEALERDRAIVDRVAASRRAKGKPWTAEIEAQMLAEMAAKRRPG